MKQIHSLWGHSRCPDPPPALAFVQVSKITGHTKCIQFQTMVSCFNQLFWQVAWMMMWNFSLNIRTRSFSFFFFATNSWPAKFPGGLRPCSGCAAAGGALGTAGAITWSVMTGYDRTSIWGCSKSGKMNTSHLEHLSAEIGSYWLELIPS